jgi:integrase/recombinase XerD
MPPNASPEPVPTPPEPPRGDSLAIVGAPHNVPVGPLEPSSANPVDVYLSRLNTPAGRSTAVAALRRALGLLGEPPERWRAIRWASLGPEKSRALHRRLTDGFRPATVRVTLSVVRGVLQQARALGQLDANRYEAVAGKAAWPRISGESAKVGRMLAPGEIAKLESYCEGLPPTRGSMVWAMLACGLGAGLRRFEIAGLDANALSNDARSLLVFGKGRKEVVQPIPAFTGAALEAWLAQREELGPTVGTMFVPLSPAGRLKPGTLSIDAVERIVERVAREYGGNRFTPHDLRRTLGSTLLSKYDPGIGQRLMRHADVSTTFHYDRRSEDVARKAADSLDGLLLGR